MIPADRLLFYLHRSVTVVALQIAELVLWSGLIFEGRNSSDVLFDRDVDEGEGRVTPLLDERLTTVEDVSWHRPIAYHLVWLKHESRLQLCLSEWTFGESNPAEDCPQAEGGASVEAR